MKLIDVAPAELFPNPWNTNIVPPENMDKLEASLKRHGFVKPVLVRELEGGALQILGGQHRVEKAEEMGFETVPVLNLGPVDDKRAKEIGLIDNARYGMDDGIGLAELVAELGGAAELGDFLPFSVEELASLSTEIDDAEIDDLINGTPEEAPEEPPTTRRTHQMMRFKIGIGDVDDVSDTVEAVMRDQGFTEEDDKTNAGDALVYIIRDWVQRAAADA